MPDRMLTDHDIDALVNALKEHESHCKFKSISAEDLHDVVTFVQSFKAAMDEGKSVVRKTIIVLLISGVVTLVGLGSGVKLNQILKP